MRWLTSLPVAALLCSIGCPRPIDGEGEGEDEALPWTCDVVIECQNFDIIRRTIVLCDTEDARARVQADACGCRNCDCVEDRCTAVCESDDDDRGFCSENDDQ